MVSTEVTITAADGMYVRPLARFAEEAKKYESTITLECDGKTASGKSIFKLQMLTLPKGAVVRVTAEGPDEDKAGPALAELLASLS